jgi:hypothetical protein
MHDANATALAEDAGWLELPAAEVVVSGRFERLATDGALEPPQAAASSVSVSAPAPSR